MTGPRPAELLRHLAAEAAPDADLLRRFATTRDGAAFAELVRRHGPVVLAACRRGVRHHHDAEDAFQAVFLVLARRAGAIERPELLGNWLYRVAVRVTGHARRAVARRRVREVQGVDIPEPTAPASAPSDLGSVVDAELDALPAQYRDAVILCDLRGVPRADAAAALGIPLGTLASRLDSARKKLAVRFIRRGVTLSVGAVLVEARAVAVPEGLLTRTREVVAVWSAGGAVPRPVLKLVQEGLSMRSVVLSGLAALSLAAGVALAAGHAQPPDQPRPPDTPVPAAGPGARGGTKPADLPAVKLGAPRLVRKEDLRLKEVVWAGWHPDGALLMVGGATPPPDRPAGVQPEWRPEVLVLSVADRGRPPQVVELPPGTWPVGFAGDGNLLTSTRETDLISGTDALQTWAVSPAAPGRLGENGVKLTPGRTFELPVGLAGSAPSGPSALRFLVAEYTKDGFVRAEVRGLDVRDGKETGSLAAITGPLQAVRLSPDGGRVAALTAAGAVEVYGAADGRRAWGTGPLLSPSRVQAERAPDDDHLTFSGDGAVLLAAAESSRPVAFDARNGKSLAALDGADRLASSSVWRAAVSADGRLAAVAYSPQSPPDGAGGPGAVQSPRLTVWDTTTGRVVRTWRGRAAGLAFHPTRPVLAVLEPNGAQTRLGLWDFAAQP